MVSSRGDVMTDLDKLYDDAVAIYNAGDESAAIDSFIQLAKQGHTPSMVNLGHICENTMDDDRVQWLKQAVRWYKEAAKRGDADAQYNIGRLYYDGKGVRKDDKKACKWFLASAEHGGIEVDEETMQKIKIALDNEDPVSIDLPIVNTDIYER